MQANGLTTSEREQAGGGAFPGSGYHPGMTLRDWLAGQALSGMAFTVLANNRDAQQEMARRSYRLADAMLAERLHTTGRLNTYRTQHTQHTQQG